MSSASIPVLRRLNGRLQACDPCRSRKVACDHTRPVCLRCRKKKQDRHCVYTVSSTTVEASQTGSASARATASIHQDDPAPSMSPGRINLPSPSIDTSTTVVSSPKFARGSNSRAYGYLGYTSYCTVIEETLSILDRRPEDVPHSPCMDDCPVLISPKTLTLGVTILRHIPYPEDGQRFFRKDCTVHDGWVRLTAQHILDTLYTEWGDYLGHARSISKLEDMTRHISVNTAKSVVNNPDANAWLDQFRGPNLRWESIGLLFNTWDLIDNLEERQPGNNIPRKKYVSPNTQEAIMLCLELAQEFSDGNSFIVYLSYRRTVLESVVSGDASIQTWRYLADTVASLTFLGMHAEPEEPDDSYRPTFYSEISRRVLMAVFTIDKVLLAFTGRPPLLFRKFVTTPMPLDIKDEDLVLDQGSLLETIKTTVDENGWNIENGFFSGTVIRARYQLALVREQIAEIALGHDCRETVDHLLRIKERQEAVLSGFPKALLWRQEDMTNYELQSEFIFSRFLLKIETLQNDFFLYRLLIRKGSPDEGSLLAISFEMVSLVLNLWTHIDRFGRSRPDFEWLLIGYGASPGGILCKCLLKARSSQIHPSDPNITRSVVIQKLSLLVGFLDWVSPSAPNAELCKDCKSVIERVLDQALNTAPGETATFSDGANWDFSAQLDFNFDLMDTFEWLRSD